jgi:hypothetical protein
LWRCQSLFIDRSPRNELTFSWLFI